MRRTLRSPVPARTLAAISSPLTLSDASTSIAIRARCPFRGPLRSPGGPGGHRCDQYQLIGFEILALRRDAGDRHARARHAWPGAAHDIRFAGKPSFECAVGVFQNLTQRVRADFLGGPRLRIDEVRVYHHRVLPVRCELGARPGASPRAARRRCRLELRVVPHAARILVLSEDARGRRNHQGGSEQDASQASHIRVAHSEPPT